MKMTKTEWIEVQNSNLFDTFVEISSNFNDSLNPSVILRKSDSWYVKLTQGDMWWAPDLNSFNNPNYHKHGRWQLSEPKAGKTKKLNFQILQIFYFNFINYLKSFKFIKMVI